MTLRDAELAREAVDEGMARAYPSWHRVRGYRNVEGWVHRVALNWALSQKRKTHREIQGSVQVDAHVSAAYPDTDLQIALADLSVEHRAVVVLRRDPRPRRSANA